MDRKFVGVFYVTTILWKCHHTSVNLHEPTIQISGLLLRPFGNFPMDLLLDCGPFLF